MKRLFVLALAATFAQSAVATDVKDHPRPEDMFGFWCGSNDVGYYVFNHNLLVYKNGDKTNQLSFDDVAVNGSTIRLTYTDIVVSGNAAEKKSFYLEYQLTPANDVLIEKQSKNEYRRCEREKVIYAAKSSTPPDPVLENIADMWKKNAEKRSAK